MFPTLEPAEIERLRRFGETRTYRAGERLVATGEVSPGMFVILSGEVAVTQQNVLGRHQPIVTHGPGSEAGTTLDGYLPVPHDSPFAGHGSETSNTQLVIKTGFDRLATYFNSGDAPACREFVVDGTTGLNAGVPTTGC